MGHMARKQTLPLPMEVVVGEVKCKGGGASEREFYSSNYRYEWLLRAIYKELEVCSTIVPTFSLIKKINVT